MLDLNDIGLFVQVVRFGSFAEAGRRLGIPANTVSRRIQELEEQLGARLMQRSTRKLNLTDAGHELYGNSAAAVDGLQQAGEDLIAGARVPRGLIRVAMPADFFDFYRMEWVAEFLAAHPQVRIDFVLSDAAANLIEEGIDVAFRGAQTPNPNYVVRKILSRSIGLVASPSYLDAHGTPVTLQDLTRHDCLFVPQSREYATWRLQRPDGVEEEVTVTGRVTVNTAQAIRKAAIAGLGIALAPMLETSDLRDGRLAPVLPQYMRRGLSMSVVYPNRAHLPLAVSAFIDSVVGKMRAELSRSEIPVP
ncbi:LysR family transcriptional regulator [Sphingobium sp. EM0848]|uniref:LysR family transcriptional regulator n=1 Tax=Sphingobium sp. EM0848 TaxID=2743473 RepID=UPI00159C3DB8|nr:LysR family transcriptional regulator [Sphingobium sp. EM0848]